MMLKHILLFICLLLSIQFSPYIAVAQTDPEALHIQLDGTWTFFHEQLLTNIEADAALASGEGQPVTVPIEFNEFLHTPNTFGTFIKTITVPAQYENRILAIQIPYAYSAVKIFAHNQLVLESGVVGRDVAHHETMLERKVGYFHVTEQTFTIAVQISSFDHIRGGFANSITLGEPSIIQKKTDQQNFLMLFIIGILTIIGLLTILLGLYERTERKFLIFGLFSLTVATRTLVTVPFLYRLLPLPISYELATRIEYLATISIGYLYTTFIYMVFRDLFHKWLVYLNFVILTFLGGFILFTEPVVFQTIFFKGFLLEVVLIFYNVYVISKAIIKKRPLALAHAIGITIVFTGMVIDYLSGIAILNVFPVSHVCTTLHVIIIVVSISRDYAKNAKETASLNKQLITLNNSLDSLVKQRTEEMHAANEQLRVANAKLTQLAQHDGLTGIYNRYYFDEKLRDYFTEAKKNHTPLSVLLFDLDEFKKYNDHYGHILGDDILRTVSRLIADYLPKDALFARYGGEEFAIVLPHRTRSVANQIAIAISELIATAKLEHHGRELGIVTLSIGGATYPNDLSIQTEMDLLELADQQLYKAKANGRNQVQFS